MHLEDERYITEEELKRKSKSVNPFKGKTVKELKAMGLNNRQIKYQLKSIKK